jgi:hypothetical protein
MPIHYDANPTVVLEAMSMGLIPIVSQFYGYIEEDGVIIVRDNNKLAWYDTISKLSTLTDSEIEKIRRRNWTSINRHFSWEQFQNHFKSQLVYVERKSKGDRGLILNELLGEGFYMRPSNFRESIVKLLRYLKNIIGGSN